MKPADCRRCKHYYVTWDQRFPNGCRAMGFKSKQSPSAEVLKNSGKPCLLFDKKEHLRHKKSSLSTPKKSRPTTVKA